ncbi:MAG: hypothetical protein ACK55Z_33850, partial [bacterium]
MHQGNDARRMDERGRPVQGMGQPGQEEEPACLGSRGEEVRGEGVPQASQGEHQAAVYAHIRAVQ